MSVAVDHVVTQLDDTCVRERQTIVCRASATGPQVVAGEPAPADAPWKHVVCPDPVRLFRYSALTYNRHRIHDDRASAARVEHYEGLVVHGPLIATLLVED